MFVPEPIQQKMQKTVENAGGAKGEPKSIFPNLL